MATMPAPTYAPTDSTPAWVRQLREVLRNRDAPTLPAAPDPDPLAAVRHRAFHWLNDVGMAAVTRIQTVVTNQPTFRLNVARSGGSAPDVPPMLRLELLQNGTRVLDYTLALECTAEDCWPAKMVRRGESPPQAPAFVPRFVQGRETPTSLFDLDADDLASDFLTELKAVA